MRSADSAAARPVKKTGPGTIMVPGPKFMTLMLETSGAATAASRKCCGAATQR